METCPCCLKVSFEFFKNHRDRKGTLYCKFCKDAYESKNVEYFKILKEIRKKKRNELKIQKGVLRCSICKIEKEFTFFIKNKSRLTGYADRCKDCNKIIYKERKLNLGNKLIEYHRTYNKAHKENLKNNSKKYYKRASTNLEDGYIIMVLKPEFKQKGIYIKTSEIPKELIEAKRISLQFKRQLKTLKEIKNEECKSAVA